MAKWDRKNKLHTFKHTVREEVSQVWNEHKKRYKRVEVDIVFEKASKVQNY